MSESDNPKPRARNKRLTEAEWAEAGALWSLGEASLQDLSNRYGPARETFSRKFKLLGIEQGGMAEGHKARIAQRMEEAALDSKTLLTARIFEVKETQFKREKGLGDASWNVLLKAHKGELTIMEAQQWAKFIRDTQAIQRGVREEQYKILGLDDGIEELEDLPELTIKELTAEKIDAMRKAQTEGGLDMVEIVLRED